MKQLKKHALKIAQYLVDQDGERQEYVEWCDINNKKLDDKTNDHPFMSAVLILDNELGE